MLVLGGGDYNIRSVARCWEYETAVMLETEVDDTIPFNDYWQYYEPDHKLHFPKTSAENNNSREYLEKLKIQVMENLRCLNGALSAQMQEVPPTYNFEADNDHDDSDRDVRLQSSDRQPEGEHFDSSRDQGMT